MPPSLLEIERTRRQSIWNPWSSRHVPESWAMHPRNGSLPIKGEEWFEKRESNPSKADWPHTQRGEGGAGDGLRTRYLDLGKVALYQVSYSRSARGKIIPRPVRSPSPRGSARSAGPSGREAGSHASPNRGWRRD